MLSKYSLKKKIFLYFSPILLTIVALNQIIQARYFYMNPWKGGGFGMFTTVDSLHSRTLKCTLIDEFDIASNCQIYFSNDYQFESLSTEYYRNLLSKPSIEKLENILTDYRKYYPKGSRIKVDDSYKKKFYAKFKEDLKSNSILPRKLILEIWKPVFNTRNSSLKFEPLPIRVEGAL